MVLLDVVVLVDVLETGSMGSLFMVLGDISIIRFVILGLSII
jgi:hypothetical protein